MAWPEQNKQIEAINGDRRYDRRYGMALDVRWKLVRRRKVLESGTGSTLDLSSGGILFNAGRPLPVGLNVELSISWPALLHNVAPMQLVVAGRIVRANGSLTAVQMVQHEFRTMGIAADQRPAMSNATRLPALTPVGSFGKLSLQ
jgi:hypothetical protein